MSEEQYWKEDAARINRMSKSARDSGNTIELDEGDPPQLNEDGSLKEDE